jgi:hypothetical protein
MAIVLVEDDASDMWGVGTAESQWNSPTTANVIAPPVTYGVAPSRTETFESARPLASGRTYEVILWRILPASSTAQCQQRVEAMCLMAVHAFVR